MSFKGAICEIANNLRFLGEVMFEYLLITISIHFFAKERINLFQKASPYNIDSSTT